MCNIAASQTLRQRGGCKGRIREEHNNYVQFLINAGLAVVFPLSVSLGFVFCVLKSLLFCYGKCSGKYLSSFGTKNVFHVIYSQHSCHSDDAGSYAPLRILLGCRHHQRCYILHMFIINERVTIMTLREMKLKYPYLKVWKRCLILMENNEAIKNKRPF